MQRKMVRSRGCRSPPDRPLARASGFQHHPRLLFSPVFLYLRSLFDAERLDVDDFQFDRAPATADDLAAERTACQCDGVGARRTFDGKSGRVGSLSIHAFGTL